VAKEEEEDADMMTTLDIERQQARHKKQVKEINKNYHT
jgi:hypothetical protein